MNKIRLFLTTSSMVLLLGLPEGETALAQLAGTASTPATKSDELEVIVVTAQRREENLQNVGISVTALSGDSLRDKQVVSSVDIARLVPGVAISANGGGINTQYAIRGVSQNDFADNAEGPVAVYVDDSYIPNLEGQNFGLYDLSRVEVLKGPQGTLFGRNATGGLVNYVINKPTTDRVSGYADLTYASYNEVRSEGALSGPITDTLSARLSFLTDRHDGAWKNVYPAGIAFPSAPPSPCCQDLGGLTAYAARLQVEYKPDDRLDVRLMGAYSNQQFSTAPYTQVGSRTVTDAAGRVVGGVFAPADSFGYVAPNPNKLQLSSDYARSNLGYARSYDGSAHISYDFGDIQLVSITSYRKFYKEAFLDGEASPLNFLDVGAIGQAQDFSEEARLEGKTGPVNWTAGAYYLNIRSQYYDALMAPANSFFADNVFGFPKTGVDLTNFGDLLTQSYSIFGQIDYHITPEWKIVLGARGIDEQQRYKFISNGYIGEGDYVVAHDAAVFPVAPLYLNKRTDYLWAAKAQLDYQPSEDLLLYAGINRGVKGGNYNAPTGGSLPAAQMAYAPEELLDYEAGFKSTLAGGKLQIDGSIYDYDYQNYQAFSYTGLSGYVQNKPARTYGAEISIAARPIPPLLLSVVASAFHARVKDEIVSTGVAPRTVQPTFAPDRQVAVDATYTLPLTILDGTTELGGDMSYSAGFYTNIQNFTDQYLPGYALFDAHLTWYDAADRFRVTIFANNLADRRYGTVLFDLSSTCGCSEKSFGQPRWVGVTLGYKF